MQHVISKSVLFKKIESFLQYSKKIPVIAIVGPTGSGKSGLSVELGKKFNGVVISADSRQIIKGLPITTGVLSPEEQQEVPHFGLEISNATEKWDAYKFQQFAKQIIAENKTKKTAKIHIICGGTMLWVDGLLKAYDFDEKIEVEPEYDVFWIGCYWEREKLYERINSRVEAMLDEGLVNECITFLEEHLLAHNGIRTSIGVLEADFYHKGLMKKARMVEKIKQRTRKYAKRQLTWWRGRNEVFWVDMQEER